jgi:two-component system, NarL family, sensor histidine kinase DegS
VKHSGMRHFVVQLSAMPGEVTLCVSDAGVGFAPEDKRFGRGLGLVSMRERIRMVGGVISIESRPAGGTTVCARVPLTSS